MSKKDKKAKKKDKGKEKDSAKLRNGKSPAEQEAPWGRDALGQPLPPIEGPGKAMVIFAHPDDAEFTCSGTVAKMAAEGWHMIYVLLTSGDKGTHDLSMTHEKLAAIREHEQREACRVLGVKECIFLGYPDGFTVADNDLVNQIVRLLRKHRPDVVITWDGYRGTFNHRDHRNCGIAVADALYPATRDRLYYHHLERDEGLGQHPVNEVLLFGSSEPDYTVDITDHWETKVDAILCHASQIGDRTREDFMKQRKEMEERTGQTRIEEKFRRWSIRRPQPQDTKQEEAEKAAESEPQEAAREQDPVVAVPDTAGWKPQRGE